MVDKFPTFGDYGFGELTAGVADKTDTVLVSLCILNDPRVNQFLLDSHFRAKDRRTGTQIFPRDGMALMDGKVYSTPAEKNEENK